MNLIASNAADDVDADVGQDVSALSSVELNLVFASKLLPLAVKAIEGRVHVKRLGFESAHLIFAEYYVNEF